MNELLIWTLAAVAALVVALLLWLARRRQQRAQDAAVHREEQRMALEQAEHVARAQRLAAECDAQANQPDTQAGAAEAHRRDEAEREAADITRRIAEAEATRLAREQAEYEAARAAEAQRVADEQARQQAEREAAEAAARAAREAEETARLAREQAEREAAEARAREEAERLAREQAEREAAAASAARLAAEAQAREQAEREAAEAAAAAVASRELRADETLVLVADDSKIVRVKLSRLLTAQSYRVALAESGEQALELMAAERPHVLITDVEMPGIDGFELTRQVRAAPATAALPVLMITSSDDKQEQARAAGVTQLLGKPFSEEALLAAIERARLAVRVPASA